MKLEIKDKNNIDLEIIHEEIIEDMINELKSINRRNPSKNVIKRLDSILCNEAFSSIFLDGDLVSRKKIEKSFMNRELISFRDKNEYDRYWLCYAYVLSLETFNPHDFFTLYYLLGNHGKYPLRKDEDVHTEIKGVSSSNFLFDPSEIEVSLDLLTYFLNSSDIDVYLKAIIGYVYFLMVSPFNRENEIIARIIPLWVFNTQGRLDEMIYFITSLSNYKHYYNKTFRHSFNQDGKFDLDLFLMLIIKLLIINQKQYIWLKTKENKYISETKKGFDNIQKSFLWKLMINQEISGLEDDWIKMSDEDLNWIELNLKDSHLSMATRKLMDAGIISKSSTRPVRYKLIDYELIGLFY